MSDRRPSRARKAAITELTSSQAAGLHALVEDNASDLTTMLSMDSEAAHDHALLVTKLREVMGVNALTCEALLARFFSAESLSAFCTNRMGVSGKGGVPVLAARIARALDKPGFKPKPNPEETKTVSVGAKRGKRTEGEKEGGKTAAKKSKGGGSKKQKEDEDEQEKGKEGERDDEDPLLASEDSDKVLIQAPFSEFGYDLKFNFDCRSVTEIWNTTMGRERRTTGSRHTNRTRPCDRLVS